MNICVTSRPVRARTGRPVVEVWVLDLDDPGTDDDQAAQVLSAAELARAAQLPRSPQGRRYRNSRVQLRQLLSRYCGQRPADIGFTTGMHGKPALATPTNGRLRFNTSRSGGLGLVAITRDGVEVGVDVENVLPHVDLENVAERFFPTAELAAIAALPAAARPRARYQCWTRAEAELKGVGTGLVGEMSADGQSTGDLLHTMGNRPDWWVDTITVRAGFAAALAVERGTGPPARILVRDWDGLSGMTGQFLTGVAGPVPSRPAGSMPTGRRHPSRLREQDRV